VGVFFICNVYFSVEGFMFKRRAKGNDWSRRWFVLNEKSGKVCSFCVVISVLLPIRSLQKLVLLLFLLIRSAMFLHFLSRFFY
jgi:hypothetical protein